MNLTLNKVVEANLYCIFLYISIIGQPPPHIFSFFHGTEVHLYAGNHETSETPSDLFLRDISM